MPPEILSIPDLIAHMQSDVKQNDNINSDWYVNEIGRLQKKELDEKGLIIVDKTQLAEIREQNRDMKADISETASALNTIEVKYKLFTIFQTLKPDSGVWSMLRKFAPVLTKIMRDPEKQSVFQGLINTALKYAHLIKK